jgi:hypothetical protein
MNRKEIESSIAKIAETVLRKQGFIRPVDVFMAMEKLSEEDFENWRKGKVPYLERVIQGSLNNLQFILKTIQQYATSRNLTTQRVVYHPSGKKASQALRFSKSGSQYLENLYSTRYELRKHENPGGHEAPQENLVGQNSDDTSEVSLNTTQDAVIPSEYLHLMPITDRASEISDRKTVFILGAGFSKAAGGPLQSEILGNIFEQNTNELDGDYRQLYEENRRWLNDFLENEHYVEPEHFKDVALEDLYTPIDRCILDNVAYRNNSPSELIEARQKLNSLIVMLIDHKLRGDRAEFRHADRFAEYLVSLKRANPNKDPFSIISTNWDILIDNAVKLRTILNKDTIDYCFDVLPYRTNQFSPNSTSPDRDNFKIKILKLHGSMNWLRCQRCQRVFITFFEKIALDDYLRKPPCRLCLANHSTGSELEAQASLVSDLVMPTFLKGLNNIQLKLVWHTAALELSAASNIVFIGYSFPTADFELRQLLSRNVKHSTRIDVILHPQDKPSRPTRNSTFLPEFRYRSFFGRREMRFHYQSFEGYVTHLIDQGYVTSAQ